MHTFIFVHYIWRLYIHEEYDRPTNLLSSNEPSRLLIYMYTYTHTHLHTYAIYEDYIWRLYIYEEHQKPTNLLSSNEAVRSLDSSAAGDSSEAAACDRLTRECVELFNEAERFLAHRHPAYRRLKDLDKIGCKSPQMYKIRCMNFINMLTESRDRPALPMKQNKYLCGFE